MLLVTVWGLTASGLRAFRWANAGGFIDADENVYPPRLLDAGNYERHLVRNGRTFGASQVGYGLVRINNADGSLDHLLDVAFDGRDLLIERPDGTVVLRGTIGGTEFRRLEIAYRLRDAQALLANRPIVSKLYAGDNALPAGLEGTADDWRGQNEPQAFGKVRVANLPMVNTSRLIAQVSHRGVQSIVVDAVQDGGAAITAGSTYAALADIQSTGPTSGQYRAYLGSPLEGAYARFGSTPARIITADITEGTTSADRTVAQLMRRISTFSGFPGSRINGDTAIDSVAGWLAGYWVAPGSGALVGEALDALAASVHGWWVGTREGDIRFGLLRAPVGRPRLVITDTHILPEDTAIERVVTENEGLPVWRVVVGFQRVWTPQSRDQLAGVATADQERLGRPTRFTAPREDATIKDRHPLADELVVSTCLDTETDALALRDLLWSLYGVQRDVFRVSVPADFADAVDLGDEVELRTRRFGMSAGRGFIVIGRIDRLSANATTLVLWG